MTYRANEIIKHIERDLLVAGMFDPDEVADITAALRRASSGEYHPAEWGTPFDRAEEPNA